MTANDLLRPKHQKRLREFILEAGIDPMDLVDPATAQPYVKSAWNHDEFISFIYKDSGLYFEILPQNRSWNFFSISCTGYYPGYPEIVESKDCNDGELYVNFEKWIKNHVLAKVKDDKNPVHWEIPPVSFTHLTQQQKQEQPSSAQEDKMQALIQNVRSTISEILPPDIPTNNPLLQTINANLERLETIDAQGTGASTESTSNPWTAYEWCMLLLALVQVIGMLISSPNFDRFQFEYDIHIQILEIFPHFRLPGDNLLPEAQ